jgi:hypothetical protein
MHRPVRGRLLGSILDLLAGWITKPADKSAELEAARRQGMAVMDQQALVSLANGRSPPKRMDGVHVRILQLNPKVPYRRSHDPA